MRGDKIPTVGGMGENTPFSNNVDKEVLTTSGPTGGSQQVSL